MHKSSAMPSAILNARIFRHAFGHLFQYRLYEVFMSSHVTFDCVLFSAAVSPHCLSWHRRLVSGRQFLVALHYTHLRPGNCRLLLLLLSYATCNLHSWEARRQYVPGESCKTSSETNRKCFKAKLHGGQAALFGR